MVGDEDAENTIGGEDVDVVSVGGEGSDEEVTADWYGEADDRSLESGSAYRPAGAPLDRPRGVLSQRDREYLVGESDIEPKTQSERNVRGTIRERVKNALLDFTLLLHHLPPRDRKQIFDSPDRGVRTGIADALGFLYHETEPTRHNFERLLQMGIDHGETAALAREGYSTPARNFRDYYNVDLQVEQVSGTVNPPGTLKEIGKEIERGNAGRLTAAEIRAFFEYYAYADEFDPKLPALVFQSLAQGIDAARRPRESTKEMRESVNTSIEDWENMDGTDEE